ncbi:hypothetical protein NEOLI_002380 [Neolecta irregularis DAH-3]|uniref:Uncharacterized protein n=1 Tax=Neolecta irregularis (strain DAH-3) TaxID=1198029 RepID=A0A1U7LUL3_NEOID|nr:hypothetical protein NEOLI_002380 [Neolecta irregularis DAH-3]|eukprot:OLL26232.1 hypothetical protein NEOLI_002380 [Neolecta irregularis DAH-3]
MAYQSTHFDTVSSFVQTCTLLHGLVTKFESCLQTPCLDLLRLAQELVELLDCSAVLDRDDEMLALAQAAQECMEESDDILDRMSETLKTNINTNVQIVGVEYCEMAERALVDLMCLHRQGSLLAYWAERAIVEVNSSSMPMKRSFTSDSGCSMGTDYDASDTSSCRRSFSLHGPALSHQEASIISSPGLPLVQVIKWRKRFVKALNFAKTM